MVKNYYVTLGISRGADLSQIKKAYRKVAKEVHPDTSQSLDSQRFREVREAYETLADEETRRQYDAGLQCRTSAAPEPFPGRTTHRQGAPLSEIRRFESFVDDFFQGVVPGFFHKERYRSPQKDLYYEVILSPVEAMQGGLFPIQVPVIEPCDRCGRPGFPESLYCPACNGQGYHGAQRRFSLSIPPRTAHGTQAAVSLEDIGLPDVNLFVTIFIDPHMDLD